MATAVETATGQSVPTPYNMRYIWAVSLVAALGGLMFGYDWVVIGGAELFYERCFNLVSSLAIGWAMSSALVGAGRRLGRRYPQ